MKIIQPAKFAATPVAFHSESAIKQPAEVEIGGVRLFSVIPQTASEAFKINRALEKVFVPLNETYALRSNE